MEYETLKAMTRHRVKPHHGHTKANGTKGSLELRSRIKKKETEKELRSRIKKQEIEKELQSRIKKKGIEKEKGPRCTKKPTRLLASPYTLAQREKST